MKKNIQKLNDTGLVAYQIKCIVALINYYKYDINEWQEVLEFICDYTYLINTFGKEHGLRSSSESTWDPESDKFLPQLVLKPVLLCNGCKKLDLQFKEYGAKYGLCLNIKECQKDENDKFGNQHSKIFHLYINADFKLLRAVNNVLSHTSDISYDYFKDGRIVLLWDTLKIFDELGIPYPDFDGIHDYAFGENNITKRFSTYNLIRQEK